MALFFRKGLDCQAFMAVNQEAIDEALLIRLLSGALYSCDRHDETTGASNLGSLYRIWGWVPRNLPSICTVRAASGQVLKQLATALCTTTIGIRKETNVSNLFPN